MIASASQPASRQGDRRAAGFTLVELMVAAGLVGIVLAAGSTLVWQVTGSRARLDTQSAAHSQADAALHAITTALHNQFRNNGSDAVYFIGTDGELGDTPADTLRFRTVSDRLIRPGQPESDVHEVEFYVRQDPGDESPMLMRRTDPLPSTPSDGGGVVEVVARGVIGLDCEYFDGEQWSIDWPESIGRSPQAVRVTLAVTAHEHEQTMTRAYQRLVYFPLWPEATQNFNGGAGGFGTSGGVGATVPNARQGGMP